jgi:hypothetical protein
MTRAREIMETYGKKLMPVELHTGIYFLVKNNEVVYIGQSKTIEVRVSTHIGAKDFDKAYYFECPLEELDEVEMELIRAVKPVLNTAHMIVNIRVESRKTKFSEYLRKKIESGKYGKQTQQMLNAMYFGNCKELE